MIWIVIAALAVWLLVVTLVLAGFVRLVATLELARRAGPVPVATLDLDGSGPEVGQAVPEEVTQVLQAHLSTSRIQYLLVFVSPGCGTCLELIEQIGKRPELRSALTLVVLGPTVGQAATEFAGFADPLRTEKLAGDEARVVMRELGVGALPFGVALADDAVRAKAYLRKTADLEKLATSLNSEKAETV